MGNGGDVGEKLVKRLNMMVGQRGSPSKAGSPLKGERKRPTETSSVEN